MQKIYKYPLRMDDTQIIQIPSKSTLLSVGMDPNEDLCVWALVRDTAATEPVQFWIFGTGKELRNMEDKRFLGTVRDDQFMWHVFTEADQK